MLPSESSRSIQIKIARIAELFCFFGSRRCDQIESSLLLVLNIDFWELKLYSSFSYGVQLRIKILVFQAPSFGEFES